MIVDPLHDLADIQAAVDNLALEDPDTNPMVQLMTQMSRQLSALNIQQAVTKKQNALLLVSVRKARVDETVGNMYPAVPVVEPVMAPAQILFVAR